MHRPGDRRDHRHDAARHRDRRRAHRAGAARHRRDRPELRHRPGRDERAPAPPVPARPGRRCPACPTPACPSSTPRRRALPADPGASSPTRTTRSSREYGLALVGGCCGTTPEHLRQVVERVGGRDGRAAPPASRAGRLGLYQPVPFRQDTSYLSIGERTNANGSKAFREAMLAQPLGRLRRDRPRADPRRRAPARPLRRLRRPRRRRRHARGRRPAGHRLDAAARARLHRARGASRPAWRCSAAAPSSTRSTTRTATAPARRFARIMPLVKEHGAAVVALTIDEEGQARTAEWKVRVADRLDRRPDRQLGDARRGHPRRLPDLPDRHRPGGDPPRRHRDDRGDPRAQAPPPRRADHARRLQRLVRPQPGRPRGAQLGVPARVRRGRPRLGDRARRRRSCRWRGSPRSSARSPSTWSTTGAGTPPTATLVHDPLHALPRAVRGRRRRRPARRRGPPSWPRCRWPSGCSGGSSTASATGSRPTSTRRCRPGRPWRSSTTPCSRA